MTALRNGTESRSTLANGHFGETLLNLRLGNGDWPKTEWLDPLAATLEQFESVCP